jgi:hypothetical protein
MMYLILKETVNEITDRLPTLVLTKANIEASVTDHSHCRRWYHVWVVRIKAVICVHS